jgi:hypothetical protein
LVVGLDNGRGFFSDFRVYTLYFYVVDCVLLFSLCRFFPTRPSLWITTYHILWTRYIHDQSPIAHQKTKSEFGYVSISTINNWLILYHISYWHDKPKKLIVCWKLRPNMMGEINQFPPQSARRVIHNLQRFDLIVKKTYKFKR